MSRIIGNLARLYSDKEKFSGTVNDDFEHKSTIFVNRCRQAEIYGDEAMAMAFSVMLTESALTYYYLKLTGITSYSELKEQMRARFYSEERTRALVREWEGLSLPRYISKNSGMTKSWSLTAKILKT